MSILDIKTIAVVGAGLMGRQIALNSAIYGYNVNLNDVSVHMLDEAQNWIKDYLDGRVIKGRLTKEQADETLNRLSFCNDLKETVSNVQLVIEAIVEDLNIKLDFYDNINKFAPKDTIFASNSSYIVSSEFKTKVANPSRLANLHYFNPALVLKLVEVVKGEHTSEDTIETLIEFAKKTGKTPIRVNKEIDGFVVNRILRAIRDEAFFLVDNEVVSPTDLDTGVELGLNHPMGPFKLLDLTGIDLFYRSSTKRWNDTGTKPNGYDLIEDMYKHGEYGRKTGKGFYDYSEH